MQIHACQESESAHKMELIDPVFFELSCKQWKLYTHTYRTARHYIPALPTGGGDNKLIQCAKTNDFLWMPVYILVGYVNGNSVSSVN